MFSRLYQADQLRAHWRNSKAFRALLVAVVIFFVLRLALQGVLLMGAVLPPPPDMAVDPEDFVPADLLIYINAGRHFQAREDLYLQGSLDRLEEHYPYAPSFAAAFTIFLWLSPGLIAVLHTVLHVLAYALLYAWWDRLFRKYELPRARSMLAWTLPLWLLFAAFWGDLVYLNIYLPMALLGTLFIEAVLDENPLWSAVWLTVILQIKPHWAFAATVPLLLGRWRFFGRMLLYTAVGYVAVAAVVLVIGGIEYGVQQYGDYVGFLTRLSADFPWRGPEDTFLGYNHSVKQTVVYFLGVSEANLTLATALKFALLIPLGVVGLRYLLQPVRRAGHEVPQLGLELAFALYLGAFIWLDMVWEVSLGIVVFTYLLATVRRRGAQVALALIFLPYALVDCWQTLSYVIFGEAIIVPGPYMLTDPSIYLPVILFVILAFYAVLVWRLWTAHPAYAAEPVETRAEYAHVT